MTPRHSQNMCPSPSDLDSRKAWANLRQYWKLVSLCTFEPMQLLGETCRWPGARWAEMHLSCGSQRGVMGTFPLPGFIAHHTSLTGPCVLHYPVSLAGWFPVESLMTGTEGRKLEDGKRERFAYRFFPCSGPLSLMVAAHLHTNMQPTLQAPAFSPFSSKDVP